MNTASIRQPRSLSLASLLVAAGAVAISIVAISTDDVGDLPVDSVQLHRLQSSCNGPTPPSTSHAKVPSAPPPVGAERAANSRSPRGLSLPRGERGSASGFEPVVTGKLRS